MRPVLAACLLGLALALPAAPPAAAAPVTVDDFEDPARWQALPADGVSLSLSADSGYAGRALRLDFDFGRGGGYAIARRALDLELPAHYRFRFRVRGETLPQTLEFKLVDSTGENVWWANLRDFRFTPQWDSVSLKKRHITFAWGPAGGGELRRAVALEFAVTAASGGRGTVWLDELTLEALPPPDSVPAAPRASASSAAPRGGAALAVDGKPATAWRSRAGEARPWLALDLGGEREFGGLVLDWAPGLHAADYALEVSADGEAWRTLREVRGSNGGRDWLYLPESEARRLRVRALAAAPRGLAVREIALQPLAWSRSREAFFEAVARDAPRGAFPRAIAGEQTFWTVVGPDGAREEALLSQDGQLETGKAGWSIEPFLHTGGKLVTWADVRMTRTLEDGFLPVPSVTWERGALRLTVTAIASPDTSSPRVYARYRVRNAGRARARATLYLALRPFQVNPPAQFLNTPGGTARLPSLRAAPAVVWAGEERGLVTLTPPSGFGAVAFDGGDITEFLRAGRLPAARQVTDPFGHASGALAYALDLVPGATQEVDLVVPLRDPPQAPAAGLGAAGARQRVEEELAAARASWRARTERATIELPDSAADLVRTVKSQIAYVLVNRDGPAIQPGSRSYERSWIRDGALTSTALLRLGQADVVHEFLEWFAGHQFASGKVPCCVDGRGADPVPEHDSSGEFIYLAAEYFRFTGDRGLAEQLWPAVAAAAAYLDSLRQTRRTDEYRADERRHFFGLLPPSISHEGYSAKPMHSYWDDLFALRGFADAAYLAGALGRAGEERRWAAARDEFRRELVASMRLAMARHGIDYLPGSADLGDFDATSTTIALDPVQAEDALPDTALRRTFERYWEFFTERRDGRRAWEAFTPYEMRNVGAFVRLGWRERAHELLSWFLRQRRPEGWNQWAEVVWQDERTPHFIGDLPHTWVGSDYVRSVLDLFAYHRERDEALVLAAGVPPAWVERASGVRVSGLATPYGEVTYAMGVEGDSLVVRLGDGGRVPPGGYVVRLPDRQWSSASLDGGPWEPVSGEVTVTSAPAVLVLRRPDASAR